MKLLQYPVNILINSKNRMKTKRKKAVNRKNDDQNSHNQNIDDGVANDADDV